MVELHVDGETFVNEGIIEETRMGIAAVLVSGDNITIENRGGGVIAAAGLTGSGGGSGAAIEVSGAGATINNREGAEIIGRNGAAVFAFDGGPVIFRNYGVRQGAVRTSNFDDIIYEGGTNRILLDGDRNLEDRIDLFAGDDTITFDYATFEQQFIGGTASDRTSVQVDGGDGDDTLVFANLTGAPSYFDLFSFERVIFRDTDGIADSSRLDGSVSSFSSSTIVTDTNVFLTVSNTDVQRLEIGGEAVTVSNSRLATIGAADFKADGISLSLANGARVTENILLSDFDDVIRLEDSRVTPFSSEVDFHGIDGGAGFDTLVIDKDSLVWDIRNIERLVVPGVSPEGAEISLFPRAAFFDGFDEVDVGANVILRLGASGGAPSEFETVTLNGATLIASDNSTFGTITGTSDSETVNLLRAALTGSISLADGNDRVDLVEGSLDGVRVDLGGGDDLLVYRLVETLSASEFDGGAGTDLLQLSAGDGVTVDLGTFSGFERIEVQASAVGGRTDSAVIDISLGASFAALDAADTRVTVKPRSGDGNASIVIDSASTIASLSYDFDAAGGVESVNTTVSGHIVGDLVMGGGADLVFVEETGAIGGVIRGGMGSDTFSGGQSSERYVATLPELDGDSISVFAEGDSLTIEGASIFGGGVSVDGIRYSVSAGDSSAAFDLSSATGREVLFSGQATGSTSVTTVERIASLSEGARVLDDTINGIANARFLSGETSSTFKVTILAADAGADFSNSLGIYEVRSDGSIADVILLQDNVSLGGEVLIDGIDAGSQLGFFVLQNGAGRITGTDLSIDISTGTAVLLQDGGAIDAPVFLSHDASLNVDGMEHVLSGGGDAVTSLRLGFEDLIRTEGSDDDFQDVVFTVEAVDPALPMII